jgi:hypothetical protein
MKPVNTNTETKTARSVLVRKEQLISVIVNNKGKPDYLAINLYWDEFRFWYNPKKEIKDSNVVHIHKLHNKSIQTCYEHLSSTHGCSRETRRKKIVLLEKLGLISICYNVI